MKTPLPLADQLAACDNDQQLITQAAFGAKMADFLDIEGDQLEGDTEPGNDGVTPRSRNKGGRPKGSRNKVTADAREVLAGRGRVVMETLCRIAAGQPIFRTLKGGARERIDPDMDAILAAGKIVGPMLAPVLKSAELSGKDGAPLHPPAASLMAYDDWRGAVGGTRAEYEAYVLNAAREAGERGVGLNWLGYGGGEPARPDVRADEARQADAPSKPVAVDPAPAPRPGSVFDMGSRGVTVELHEITDDCREVWLARDGNGEVRAHAHSRADIEHKAREAMNRGEY